LGTLQVLSADEKRLHVLMRIEKDGAPVATIEQMLLHVDMAAGKTCPAAQSVLDRLLPIAKAHASLPKPEAAGRHVGQRK
jgi:carnitine 3-dehydrogenase